MNELYEDLLPMIAKMHAIQRGFWQSRWLEKSTSLEQAEDLLSVVVLATTALERARDVVNDMTGCGEPVSLQINAAVGFHADPPLFDPDH